MHAADPGPGDIAGDQAVPPGSYCTMNMVDSAAPRSLSTIIFTVMPL